MRKEYQHPSEEKGLAIGVDAFLVPGDPTQKIFLQVWDASECEQPCNEGAGGFNNLLVNEVDPDMERIIAVIREYGFIVPPTDLFEIHDASMDEATKAKVDAVYPTRLSRLPT